MNKNSKDRQKLELVISSTVCAVMVLLMVLLAISIDKYEIQEVKVNEPVRESTELPVYEYNGISEQNIGEKVLVLGFMCNEVGIDTGVAWLSGNAFVSKEEVAGELRIESSSLIEYTPMAVAVSGEVVKITEKDGDEQSVGIKVTEIYIYSGEIEKYNRLNEIFNSGVFDAFMSVFVAGEVNTDNSTEFELALEKCCELGEEELEALGNKMKSSDASMEELYNEFNSLMRKR
jgi:hypothetical protein